MNGPRTTRRTGTAAKRYRVLRQRGRPEVSLPRPAEVRSDTTFAALLTATPDYPESQIRAALRQVGKDSADDELNCGGCGYDSCRAFAMALISQKAERAMCVAHMRKLAHKKADALLQKMPSAVVIVNDAMRVIEFNAAFAGLVAKGAPGGAPQIEGVMLSELLPFANLFHSVLKTGDDIPDRDLRFQSTILHAAIFTI